MKKIITIAAALMLTISIFAQAPEKMSYQAVVRNSSDALVTTQAVGMQISILQGSATGALVYVETQTPSTNANGLVSLEIGTGTVVSGDFTTIDWATDTYFIKTETDPTGGTTYTITGTSQLMSVPYALHAKTAESITGGITETDPVFTVWDKSSGISITESQISNLTHTVDTDTHIDAAGVTALGFTTGAHTTKYTDAEAITAVGAHTVDTDTHIDATGVTALGFTSGAHTTKYTDAEAVTAVGAHTVDTDTHLDAAGVTALGFTSGAHTTKYTDAEAVTAVGAHTVEIDGSITNEIQTISRTGTTVTLNNGGGTFTDSVNIYTAGTGIDITNNVISSNVVSTASYRWTSFSTYNQAFGWYANNDPNMFGGIPPSVWSDANGIASNMSSDKQILLTLFNKKAYSGNNAVVFANEWFSYSSTNGQFAGALFRIENTTGSNIVWNAEWFSTAYGGWGERSSVTINGANTWNSGGANYGATHHESTAIIIPANRISTIIFIAGSSSPSGSSRGTYLAFDQNCLNLPSGLKLVDDLDTAPNGWGF